MKRDADLIRRIALETEALNSGELLAMLAGVDQHTFAGHVKLMLDAGLIDARIQGYLNNAPAVAVLRLTMDGHDFLEAARSDTIWNKAKESIIAIGVPWSLGLLKEWLKAEIRNRFPSNG